MKSSNYKSVLCTYFEQSGYCKNGKFCHFAHGRRDLRAEPAGDSQESEKKPGFFSSSAPESMRLKTVSCKFFERGECRNEENCRFSHAESGPRGDATGDSPDLLAKRLEVIHFELVLLYQEDKEVREQLKSVEKRLEEGEREEAAEGLEKVLHNPELLLVNKEEHSRILKEAQEFGAMKIVSPRQRGQRRQRGRGVWKTPDSRFKEASYRNRGREVRGIRGVRGRKEEKEIVGVPVTWRGQISSSFEPTEVTITKEPRDIKEQFRLSERDDSSDDDSMTFSPEQDDYEDYGDSEF